MVNETRTTEKWPTLTNDKTNQDFLNTTLYLTLRGRTPPMLLPRNLRPPQCVNSSYCDVPTMHGHLDMRQAFQLKTNIQYRKRNSFLEKYVNSTKIEFTKWCLKARL